MLALKMTNRVSRKLLFINALYHSKLSINQSYQTIELRYRATYPKV